MKYLAQDGRTAEIISHTVNNKGQIRIMIDGCDEQQVVYYDDFIKEFNRIAKDNSNSLSVHNTAK